MKKLSWCLMALIAVATISGCVSSRRGDVYSRDEARRTHTVEWATVEHVRAVQLEGTQSQVGATAGAVVGGIAGSAVGDGVGQRLATAAGVIIGGVVGSATEEAATRRQAMEITVRRENGESIAIVQEGDPAEFAVGQRVRILRGYGATRVSP